MGDNKHQNEPYTPSLVPAHHFRHHNVTAIKRIPLSSTRTNHRNIVLLLIYRLSLLLEIVYVPFKPSLLGRSWLSLCCHLLDMLIVQFVREVNKFRCWYFSLYAWNESEETEKQRGMGMVNG
jgi:hypothetical protein